MARGEFSSFDTYISIPGVSSPIGGGDGGSGVVLPPVVPPVEGLEIQRGTAIGGFAGFVGGFINPPRVVATVGEVI